MYYSLEQEKLKNSLEMTQKKCIEIGKISFHFLLPFQLWNTLADFDYQNALNCLIIELLLKIKEEELNSIITEMRRNCTSLQEKLIKEETEKSVRKNF